ncbi:hypothetical protein LXL04_010188 [Taraxacum kok-saghyz]
MVLLVKQVASATNSAVGDGTNCATVLTQAIFKEGGKSVVAGVNVMHLRSNDKYTRRNYTDGNTLFNELEVVEGMKLGRGYILILSPTQCHKNKLENLLIFIHDKKISDINSLVKILDLAVGKNGPLLIVAGDLESDRLAMLIINKRHAGIKVTAKFWRGCFGKFEDRKAIV